MQDPPGPSEPPSRPSPPPGMEDYYGAATTRPVDTNLSYGLPPPPTAPRPTRKAGPIVSVLFVAIGAVGGFFAFRFFANGAEPPTQAEVTAAFTPLTGYTYEEVPDAQLQPMRDAIASEPELEEGIAVFDARQVRVGSQTVAAMIILGIDPDEFSGDYREEFLDGFEAGSGSAATSIQLGGDEAYSGEALGSHFIAFFDEKDGLIFMVIGVNQGSVTQIAEQVHTGNAPTS